MKATAMAKWEHLELRYIAGAQCYVIEVSPAKRGNIWASLQRRLNELEANTDTKVKHHLLKEGFKVSRVSILDALSLDGWEQIAGDLDNLHLATVLFRREIPSTKRQQSQAKHQTKKTEETDL